MKMPIRNLLVCLLTLSMIPDLLAQRHEIMISGRVMESKSEQPVPFATIAIRDSIDKQLIAGTTTDDNGYFSLASSSHAIHVEISFLGFITQTITEIKVINGKADLGTIWLSEDIQALEEVVVTGDKSQTVFKLDKRIFNVGEDLSSTGASALEVLSNVPSVNVSIEGQVSLRGSTGVQILINGKPSVLASDNRNALGSITADMIERVEVITNPSAKYEAEGTAGIINIVIKKEERKGVNGSFSLNTGYPHNHSAGLSLNRRSEKFNLFGQLGAGYRSLPRYEESINTDLTSGITLISDGTEYRNETFVNLILGTDYYIDSFNVITLSGSFAYEFEDQPSGTDFKEKTGELVSGLWHREEETSAGNPKWQYDLQYKRDFRDDEDHDLLISALGTFFGKDQNSEFMDVTSLGPRSNSFQRTATSFKESKYTFQADYTKLFADIFSLEAGGQYVMHDVSNDYEVLNLVNNEWIADSGLTNLFEYDQKVLGLYGTGSYEGEKWGVKAGLRFEHTKLHTLLTNTGEANDRNYYNFFPSAHVSFKATERLSLQAGYSRRIYRPRLWDLNPFFNIRNNFSIRTGNPNLQPEFTNAYELNTICILNKASFSFGIYHNHTTELIEQVSMVENNVNTSMPVNIGTNRATGAEFNFKYNPAKWVAFNGDFNYNFYIRKGQLENQSFDFNAHRWTSKLSAKFKIPADFELEMTGNYESRYQTAQRQESDNIFADIGLRKKFNGGKAVINISVRDLFASRRNESEIREDDFYLYSSGRRGTFVSIGFSYGIGKGEAMVYSGGRR